MVSGGGTNYTYTKEAQFLNELIDIKDYFDIDKISFEVNGVNQLFNITHGAIQNDNIHFGIAPNNTLALTTPENIPYIFSKEIRLSVGEINSFSYEDEDEEEYFSYINVTYPETFDDIGAEISTLGPLSLDFPFAEDEARAFVCWVNGSPCVNLGGTLTFFTEETSLDDILNFEDVTEVMEHTIGQLKFSLATSYDEDAQPDQYVLTSSDPEFLENFAGKVLTLSSRHCESSETDVYVATRPLEIWYDIIDRPTIASMEEALSMLDFLYNDDSSGGGLIYDDLPGGGVM